MSYVEEWRQSKVAEIRTAEAARDVRELIAISERHAANCAEALLDDHMRAARDFADLWRLAGDARARAALPYLALLGDSNV